MARKYRRKKKCPKRGRGVYRGRRGQRGRWLGALLKTGVKTIPSIAKAIIPRLAKAGTKAAVSAATEYGIGELIKKARQKRS